MKKLTLALMAAFLLVVGMARPTLASAPLFQVPLPPTHSKFKGESAVASFSSTDPNDACLQNSAFVFATEGRAKAGPGKPATVSEVSVSLFRYNSCTDAVLVDAFGAATVSAAAFQVVKLNTATLQATVTVCDVVSGTCFPVDINLTWTATGDVLREKFSFRSDFGHCKFSFRSLSRSRQAVATGSVTALGINFSPAPSNFAQIASVQTGTSEIHCP